MSNVRHSSVAILLCTYQGQTYLSEQLESFAAQTHSHWKVWASDDGSEDATKAILEAYKQRWPDGRLSICAGPGEGFASNFLSLTCEESIEADYYAYSDQDDVWEADKLERAVKWLETVPGSVPALYCSRTRLVDAQNKDIGFSPLFDKPPSFANALMQNIGGGNTMVFNNAARDLLCKSRRVRVVTHDWWAYMIVAGCGGRVFYDSHPSIRYRQHDANLVGMNSHWSARWARIRMHWDGTFRQWNDMNIESLSQMSELLTNDNRRILKIFSDTRNKGLITRIAGLNHSGVYRQTFLGGLGIIAGAILKKL